MTPDRTRACGSIQDIPCGTLHLSSPSRIKQDRRGTVSIHLDRWGLTTYLSKKKGTISLVGVGKNKTSGNPKNNPILRCSRPSSHLLFATLLQVEMPPGPGEPGPDLPVVCTGSRWWIKVNQSFGQSFVGTPTPKEA